MCEQSHPHISALNGLLHIVRLYLYLAVKDVSQANLDSNIIPSNLSSPTSVTLTPLHDEFLFFRDTSVVDTEEDVHILSSRPKP